MLRAIYWMLPYWGRHTSCTCHVCFFTPHLLPAWGTNCIHSSLTEQIPLAEAKLQLRARSPAGSHVAQQLEPGRHNSLFSISQLRTIHCKCNLWKRNILQTIVLDYASFSFFTLFNRFDWHILKQADVHMTGYVWCRRHSRWHTGTIVKLSSSTILCAFQGTSSSSEHRINVTNDTKALCWSSNSKTWWFNVSLAKEKQHIFQNLQEFHVSDFVKRFKYLWNWSWAPQNCQYSS